MIAKRITSKAAKPRFARLSKYVTAAQGGLDPRSWTRTADYMLDSGVSSRGEKVGGVRVTNCNTDDPAAATTLIEATQAANTRSKIDKTYHLVFSFPPGENPDLKTLHAIEDELVSSIGYADHQRISAVHIDTDHLHVHVAINKVHPKGFQNIEPYYDQNKLMEACERLELQYGLQRTNHGLTGERKREKRNTKQPQELGLEQRTHNNGVRINGSREVDANVRDSSGDEKTTRPKNRAADAEAHSGIETLTGFVTREVAPAMREAKNWQELHAALAQHGLEIKKRGAGLVIGSGDTWTKASQCDRSFSLKSLTDRLGAFEQSVHPASRTPPPVYQPKPKQQHPSSALLFEQYQQERLRLRVARENGIKQIDYEAAMMEHQLKKWNRAECLIVKAGVKGPTQKVALKIIAIQTAASRKDNWKKTQLDKRQLFIETHSPNWAGWLARQVEWGSTEALAVLRSREDREQMQGDYLTAHDTDTANHFVVRNTSPFIDRNGAITYKTMDGGIVIDRSDHVQCLKATTGAAQLAVELAAKRFEGQVLIVEGREEFKKEVARLAGIYGVAVRFADPAMEQTRHESMPPNTKKRQLSKGNEAEL